MKRKIVEQGLSKTKVISIPIKWVRKYGLEKGDEVIIEEAGPKLILSTPKTLSFKETISFKQAFLEPQPQRVIGKMYMAGYDHIELTNITNKKSLEVTKQHITESVLGLEIIEESKEKVVFESIVTETEEQYNNYEQKVFQTALQYAKAVRDALSQRDYDNKDINNLEAANNKFASYCERYLNKKGLKNYAFTYIIIWSTEKIADEYKYLFQHAQKHNLKPSKELLAYYDETVKYFEKIYQLYNTFSMDLLSQVMKQKKQLVQTGEDLLKKETKFAHHLLNIINITFNLIGNIIARTYSQPSKKTV